MNHKTHLQPDTLKSLLLGDRTPEQTREDTRHIEECERCQERLDRLAASPEIWEKAAELITDTCISETIANFDADFQLNQRPNASSNSAPNASQLAWDFPVHQLLAPASHPEMLGRIGDYDVEREIGRGGMGVVFKGFDSELHRPIAIKMLAPHLAASGAARKRFAREARAAAAIFHPNVIPIHGVSLAKSEQLNGQIPFLTMPFIAGPSLRLLVEENGPLDQKELVRIAIQIAAGLAAAHCQELIHRDIKPANILIERGVSRVVITDFGLARAENDASMTQTGWLAGTPNFMSPEQALGKTVDCRSDLFSLGSVMYFMATGRMPFRAETPMAVLNRICNDQPTPVRSINPDLSRPCTDIIEKLLQKEATQRFNSAGELHQALEQLLAHLHRPDAIAPPIVKPRTGRTLLTAFPNGWKSIRTSNLLTRNKWLGLICVSLFVALLGCVWFMGTNWNQQPNQTARPSEAQGVADAKPKSDSSAINSRLETEPQPAGQKQPANEAQPIATPTPSDLSSMSTAELRSALEAIYETHRFPSHGDWERQAWMMESEMEQIGHWLDSMLSQ